MSGRQQLRRDLVQQYGKGNVAEISNPHTHNNGTYGVDIFDVNADGSTSLRQAHYTIQE